MKRRRLAWFVVPAILLAASLLLVFLDWIAPRINQPAFDEIQIGMSRADVERILNCPGRKWRSLTAQKSGTHPDIIVEWLDPSRVPKQSCWPHYVWVAVDMLITIQFDASERVSAKTAFTGSFDAGLLARIRHAVRDWF